MIVSLVFALIFLFSVFITGLIRRYALSRAIIDMPNERSSHTIPTPRGGGATIVIFILLATGYCFISDLISVDVFLAIDLGIIIIAMTGWVDDHNHIPAYIRAMIYVLASALSLFYLNNEYQLLAIEDAFLVKVLFPVIIVFAITWLINLYNFMDGTDAFAAIQTICTALMAGYLFYIEGEQAMLIISIVIAISTFGFLYWNWPPARIFMGDVGSCALGFCFGILALIGEMTNSIPIAIWFVLLSVFICDSTLTLMFRMMRKEKWYEAHKSHAYQRLVTTGMSHRKLALIFIMLNVFFLWPLAWLLYQKKMLALPILTIDVIMMSGLWLYIQSHYYKTITVTDN